MKKNDISKMMVNLIENGVTLKELTEAIYYLEEDVVKENEMKQEKF